VIYYFHLLQETSITMNWCLRWTICSSNTYNIHRIWQLTVRYQLQKQTVRPIASYVVERRTKQTCVFTASSSYKEVCGFYVCLHDCHTHVICVHSILNTFTHGVNSCVIYMVQQPALIRQAPATTRLSCVQLIIIWHICLSLMCYINISVTMVNRV